MRLTDVSYYIVKLSANNVGGWGDRARNSDSREIREAESYINLPATVADSLGIVNGIKFYLGELNGGKVTLLGLPPLLSQGTCQLKYPTRKIAKQFSCQGDLRALTRWFKEHNIHAGDYLTVILIPAPSLDLDIIVLCKGQQRIRGIDPLYQG